jgi:hypothetical protein
VEESSETVLARSHGVALMAHVIVDTNFAEQVTIASSDRLGNPAIWEPFAELVNERAGSYSNDLALRYPQLSVLDPSKGHFSSGKELFALFFAVKHTLKYLAEAVDRAEHITCELNLDAFIAQKSRRNPLTQQYCYFMARHSTIWFPVSDRVRELFSTTDQPSLSASASDELQLEAGSVEQENGLPSPVMPQDSSCLSMLSVEPQFESMFSVAIDGERESPQAHNEDEVSSATKRQRHDFNALADKVAHNQSSDRTILLSCPSQLTHIGNPSDIEPTKNLPSRRDTVELIKIILDIDREYGFLDVNEKKRLTNKIIVVAASIV